MMSEKGYAQIRERTHVDEAEYKHAKEDEQNQCNDVLRDQRAEIRKHEVPEPV